MPNSATPNSVQPLGDSDPGQRWDFLADHYQLFGLPSTFELDRAQLDLRYRELQARVHPDKAALLPDAEQRLAMQHSTQVNEAYQTLKNPLRRARYLLSLQGVDTLEDSNTAMPIDFLMAQIDSREAVSHAQQARDPAALSSLEVGCKEQRLVLETLLADKIDTEKDYVAAAGLVRKLRFMEKLAEEIHAAYDALDC